jgi:cathepsin L
LATIAIAGSIAALAILNINSAPAHKTFLSTPFTEAEREFINFIAKHHKNYGTKEEYEFRLQQFAQTYADVMSHDSQATGYSKGITEFADFTETEFKNMKGAFYDHTLWTTDAHPKLAYDPSTPVANGIDWRTRGAVTPVKNQGQCGSCWSFSTTGAVEGMNAVKHGSLISLSEQQMVDCSTANYGCGGGWPYKAMQYVAGSPLEREGDYPYTARDGGCAYNRAKAAEGDSGYQAVAANNAGALQAAVNGYPVSVLIEADRAVFQSYTGGIIGPNSGCGTNLDHAVLLVGYDATSWIVKNSWGASWGEGGYVRLQITGNDAGTCGVQMSPVIAV